MTISLNRLLGACALVPLLAPVFGAAPAQAQTYPDRPITLIVSYAPGGVADLLGRVFADYASRHLGQPVVVENMTGAGGNIGWNALAKSEPDGYTLAIGQSALVLNEYLYSNLIYDAQTDIVGVSPIGDSPQIFFINADLPANTLDEFIAYAQENPASYGSSGTGGLVHLSADQIARATGIEMTHVAYQGVGPAITDIMGGHVDAISVSIGPAESALDAGKLRPLVVLSEERLPYLPDVPTSAELGYPDLLMASWFGVMAPAGTPDDRIALIHDMVQGMLNDPESLQRIESSKIRPMVMSVDEFAAFLDQEEVYWQGVVEGAGIDPIQ